MEEFLMLPVPRRLKALIQPLAAIVETVDEVTAGFGDDAVDYGVFEEQAAAKVAAVEQAMHAVALSKLDIDSDFVKVWGSVHKRVGRYEAEYRCMSGPVRVTRSLYRKVGDRNGSTVDPVSLRAGVVGDGWLPRTARAMAHMLSKGTSREAEGTSQELLRLPYSRTSFERVGHAVGALYRGASGRIEEALIEAYEVPPAARSVSVSVDRVSLPMEELPPKRAARDPERTEMLDAWAASVGQRYEVSPRLAAALDEQKREVARHPAKVERNWRMAYCATVTLHDEHGEALHTIRYGRMPAGDVRGLMRGLARDVRELRQKRPDLRVVFLADGAPELWGLCDYYLSKRDVGIEAVRLLDFWHVVEYLAAAARLLESREKAWPGQFRRWKEALLERPRAAAKILKELQDSGLAKTRDIEGNQPVAAAIRYMETRLPLMRYAAARRLGLPIGSGNVEATCKSLVALRMKRPGARWKHDSGDEVLQLRALMLSDRWAPAIRRALNPCRKPVKALSSWEARAA